MELIINSYFCGEKIPLDDKLVADKLMNFIKKHISYVNIPSLRQSIKQYMSQVEEWLRASNLPQDLKYLAIVESGTIHKIDFNFAGTDYTSDGTLVMLYDNLKLTLLKKDEDKIKLKKKKVQ